MAWHSAAQRAMQHHQPGASLTSGHAICGALPPVAHWVPMALLPRTLECDRGPQRRSLVPRWHAPPASATVARPAQVPAVLGRIPQKHELDPTPACQWVTVAWPGLLPAGALRAKSGEFRAPGGPGTRLHFGCTTLAGMIPMAEHAWHCMHEAPVHSRATPASGWLASSFARERRQHAVRYSLDRRATHVRNGGA
jgi:hypothetical protein